MAFYCSSHRCSVVTTDFDVTCSERSSAVVFAAEHEWSRFETAFEVRTYWSNEYYEFVVVGRFNTYERSCCEQYWADVERCACTVRWNEVGVEFNYFFNGFYEFFEWKFWHLDTAARVLHTTTTVFDTEDTYFTVFTTESFHTFETFLSVVKNCRRDVKSDFWSVAYAEFAPSFVCVSAANVVRSRNITKSEAAPINVLCHDFSF